MTAQRPDPDLAKQLANLEATEIAPPPAAAVDLNPEDLPRGASIGRYLVTRKLGAGAMGVVYAAYDPDLSRKVAIKILRNVPGAGNEGRVRIFREAQAMARLSHQNIVAVFDVGTAFEQVFIAMEFVERGSLADWLKEPHSLTELLGMFHQAGTGLLAAHKAGLVHRDFKPDNVPTERNGPIIDPQRCGVLAHSDGGSALDSADRLMRACIGQ